MRRTAASVGRMLVTVGLLILLFVAYQLWGTGIFTARAEDRLKHQFETQTQDDPTVASTSTTTPVTSTGPTRATTTTPPPTTAPKAVQVISEGGVVGRIQIPKIGVDFYFVQGTARDDLALGPGHYPASPMPGQIGNAAIAGHRTTHSKPFYNLNELAPGDDIIISTHYGHYTYRMYRQEIVPPTDVAVVGPTPDAELTLTTCNPRYSARQRLVVHAKLVVKRSSPARVTVPVVVAQPTAKTGTSEKSSLQQGLSGDPSSRVPATIWGAVLLIVGLLWWWVYRRWRHPATWLVGVVPFLPVLFVFYVYIERLLPANY